MDLITFGVGLLIGLFICGLFVGTGIREAKELKKGKKRRKKKWVWGESDGYGPYGGWI